MFYRKNKEKFKRIHMQGVITSTTSIHGKVVVTRSKMSNNTVFGGKYITHVNCAVKQMITLTLVNMYG